LIDIDIDMVYYTSSRLQCVQDCVAQRVKRRIT